jgi:hypothetical protein
VEARKKTSKEEQKKEGRKRERRVAGRDPSLY